MTEAFTQKPPVHRLPHAPATAADIMRPAPATIEPRDHVAAAAYLMKQAGVTALVVVDDDHAKQPVGIITEADIVRAVADGKDVNDLRIRALITTHPTVINPATRIRDAARSMVTGHFRHLPVVGEAGLIGDGRHHRCLRRLGSTRRRTICWRTATGTPRDDPDRDRAHQTSEQERRYAR